MTVFKFELSNSDLRYICYRNQSKWDMVIEDTSEGYGFVIPPLMEIIIYSNGSHILRKTDPDYKRNTRVSESKNAAQLVWC